MGKASLLLVDDDEMSSQILSYILADEGYDVDLAATGGTAIEKVSAHRYDLVFLDFVLPDMSGHEVAKRMKDIRPGIKILLLTGYTKSGDPEESNYERILLKPVSPEEIVKTIVEILR
ncbi:MAG: response regulator [Candidatus Bathyarchaeota archaeon]|nr:response regulator [Candidatus Bathyarchaeota archaeon]